MKDYIVIALATLIGFGFGAGSTYYMMKKSIGNDELNIHAIPGSSNPIPGSGLSSGDPSKHPDNQNTPLTQISFKTITYDFGTIHEGDQVRTSFTFTNTGKNDLLISSCTGSCGCTVPTWPKEAIRPGQSGKIEVVFNSAGKEGAQKKSVTVIANTDPPASFLDINANVLK